MAQNGRVLPTIDEQRAFYDGWNAQSRAGKFADINEEIQRRGVRLIDEVAQLSLSRPNVLEVGCGTGWLTTQLCGMGHVTAIDLSPKAIAIAQARGLDADFRAADFLAEDLPLASYDLVVSVETLFYVHDQPAFIRKIATLLKPNGYLAMTTLNKFVYERRDDVTPVQPGQIRSWLSKSAIRELLDAAFVIRVYKTTDPQGHAGILRLLNSYKLQAVLDRMRLGQLGIRVKERLGLGGGNIIVAQRRS